MKISIPSIDAYSIRHNSEKDVRKKLSTASSKKDDEKYDILYILIQR